MEERKLFSVVAQGYLNIQSKEQDGHRPETRVNVQVVLGRFNSVEEACDFFNTIARLEFQPFTQQAIIAQTVEH